MGEQFSVRSVATATRNAAAKLLPEELEGLIDTDSLKDAPSSRAPTWERFWTCARAVQPENQASRLPADSVWCGSSPLCCPGKCTD